MIHDGYLHVFICYDLKHLTSIISHLNILHLSIFN